ncbi:MAG: Holliday junction branch migration protein RuvA [Chloroflexi bacterium]|nr:Holliday junction branch migration protein RuvA [Chloroflexota bacterium]
MISSLRGRIIARGTDHLVVDVGGLGYKVFVPRHPSGDDVTLHTHQAFREDFQALYGFESREELALFELLISVSGVGPKAALALLSIARPVDVAAALANGDASALAKAPGVGKKTAERLIVDLRGKVGGIATTSALPGGPTSDDDAVAALQALGFSAVEASAALRGVPSGPAEARVAAALRSIKRG